MTEIYEYLGKHGFVPPDLILDGRVHRFNHQGKKDGWYVGHQNHSQKTGEPFHVVLFGSWKTGEEYEYKTARKYSRSEKKAFESQIKKAISEQKKLKTQRNLEASLEAGEIWRVCGSSNTQSCYLNNKKIADLYGCKTIMTRQGRGVLVPCHDAEGKLWGLQTIYPDGTKMFMSGQRIEGCFYVIGKDTINNFTSVDNIYLCEGYSTATSIFQAIGGIVILCFNAGNLLSVAKTIKKKYDHLSIIICGDDDRFNEENTGRLRAEQAAVELMGSVVFPNFKADAKGTDFNDLHISEGLSVVKDQISGAEVVKNYIKYLGHKGDYYFYTSSSNKQIVSFARGSHTKTTLLDLMPLEYWCTMYPEKQGFGLDMAVNDLMKKCRDKGVFNDSSVRGVGFWDECINLGDNLFIDYERKPMHSLNSANIYQIGKRITPPDRDFLTINECPQLLHALSIVRWSRPDSAKFLAGWIVISPFCGSLKWRPHIWLTGPSGSGKSYVMEKFVKDMMGNYVEYFEGTTSEAGIRQYMKCDAKPIIFDEFETDDEKSAERIKYILELFRQSSSESQGKVVKGTISGQAISFYPRFQVLVSSIRVNLIHEADRNRFTICEIKRGSGEQQFVDLKNALVPLGGDYYKQLISRAYHFKNAMLANIELLTSILADRYSQRFAQQYGTLLAGYALLEKDGELNGEEAEYIIDGCELAENVIEVEETDETECIDFLLSKVVQVELMHGHAHRSISEVITQWQKSHISGVDNWVDSIIRLGIVPRDEWLYVCSKHPELDKIFKNTRWIGGWAKSLARIPDAENHVQTKILGKNKRCVRVPFDRIF